MDERISSSRNLRRLALAVALVGGHSLVGGRESSAADDPHSIASILRARRTVISDQSSDDLQSLTPLSRGVIVRPRARMIRESNVVENSVVKEASDFPGDRFSKQQKSVGTLAEMIRKAEKADAKISTGPVAKAADPTASESIRVEYAPRVNRIKLGTYDPKKRGAHQTDAVVQFVEPVQAAPLKEQVTDKSTSAKRKDLAAEPDSRAGDAVAAEVVNDSHPNDSQSSASPVANRAAEPQLPRPQFADSISPEAELLPALAAPELAQLIESSPAESLSIGSQVETLDRGVVREWSPNRSRRLANLSGFKMLSLESLPLESSVE